MKTDRVLIYALIMAAVTYLIRMIPLTLIRKEIKSKYIKAFLYYVPYAVLGAMTFPAIFYSTNSIFTAAFGFITALILSYFELGLLPVSLFACLAVFIAEKIQTFLF